MSPENFSPSKFYNLPHPREKKQDLPTGVQNIHELLLDNGSRYHMCKTQQHFPCLEIKLPEPAAPYPPLACDSCGQLMRPSLKTAEFPFIRTGLIVRFNNVLSYFCDGCDIEDSPENNLQGVIIGETLHFVSTQLDAKSVSSKPPSIKQIKQALELI